MLQMKAIYSEDWSFFYKESEGPPSVIYFLWSVASKLHTTKGFVKHDNGASCTSVPSLKIQTQDSEKCKTSCYFHCEFSLSVFFWLIHELNKLSENPEKQFGWVMFWSARFFQLKLLENLWDMCRGQDIR